MTAAGAVSVLLRVCIRAYQLMISPLFPQSCRFQPTCSQYAIEAIAAHGPLRGSWLAAKRIGRCHPFHPGGLDEVPRGVQHGS
jgi:putative membrane protein insertion efficiency factor